jgi:hypothetical protein
VDKKTTEQTIENKAEPKRKKLDASTLLNIIAYPFSGAVGLYVARKDIYDSSYETLREAMFSKQRAVLTENIEKSSNLNDGSPNPHAKDDVFRMREQYDKSRSQFYKGRGWRNVKDHFDTLPFGKKNRIAIDALTVTGITLGSLLLIANSKNVFNELFGKESDEKDKGRGRGKGIF